MMTDESSLLSLLFPLSLLVTILSSCPPPLSTSSTFTFFFSLLLGLLFLSSFYSICCLSLLLLTHLSCFFFFSFRAPPVTCDCHPFLNNWRPFFIIFPPYSSRVHTRTPHRFALGRFPTAAPSATSGRTIRTCISTWPSTTRTASRMLWSASRQGKGNVSSQLASRSEVHTWGCGFCRQHVCLRTRENKQNGLLQHTESRPIWWPALAHAKKL